MTMNHKLIFIDIDGTLFDHKKDDIPESAKEAILNAKSKGHKIFLSTGRPYADIDKEILDFPLDGMIVSCGAVVYVENKPIYCKTYPQKELINLIQLMLVNNIGFSLDGIHNNYLSEEAFICLSGLATGASWLCYYKALQMGPASVVVPIDKLSLVVTVIFSYFVYIILT